MAGPPGRSAIASCSSRPLPAQKPTPPRARLASVLVVAFPGGPGTASLVQQARRMASRSPVPIAVVEVSPSAGLWAVPAPELRLAPDARAQALHSPSFRPFPSLSPSWLFSPPSRAPAAAPAQRQPPQHQAPACSIQRSGSLWQLGIEAQELTTAIGQLAEQLETDDPEQRASALAELEAALLAEEGNKAALAAKADATCWVIEHLRGQAAYRQQQAKRLTDLARSDAGRADALEESLVFVLTQLQPSSTRFSFPNHELSSRKSQAVVIDDEQALDSEWLTVTTTTKPDKAAIKEALKAGRQITGAQLLSRRSWRIT
jgi:hypothetical protein